LLLDIALNPLPHYETEKCHEERYHIFKNKVDVNEQCPVEEIELKLGAA
jgi:hypothetical protein